MTDTSWAAERWQIHDLVAWYCHAVDDRDIDLLVDLFAPSGSFRHHDGSVAAKGSDQIRSFYRERLALNGPTFHYVHSAIVSKSSDTAAAGVVSAHSENAIQDELVVCGLRYDDSYMKLDSRWVFAERVLRKRYMLPFRALANGYAGPLRTALPGTVPRESDLPESLESWQAFHRGG